MISDTLFEACDEIEDYLANGWYGKVGDPDYDEIADLLLRMKRVRVKLDTPPNLLGVERTN